MNNHHDSFHTNYRRSASVGYLYNAPSCSLFVARCWSLAVGGQRATVGRREGGFGEETGTGNGANVSTVTTQFTPRTNLWERSRVICVDIWPIDGCSTLATRCLFYMNTC